MEYKMIQGTCYTMPEFLSNAGRDGWEPYLLSTTTDKQGMIYSTILLRREAEFKESDHSG